MVAVLGVKRTGDISMNRFCLALVSLILVSSLASAKTCNETIFEVGPYKCSIDLGRPCEVKINEPYYYPELDGENSSIYDIYCDDTIFLQIQSYKEGVHTLNPRMAKITLIENGADTDTITIDEREIDGKKGYAASGYVPKDGFNIYRAAYPISTKSICWIGTWKNNRDDFLAVLESIHIKPLKEHEF